MFDPARLAELYADNAAAALCTVVGTRGSTPRKAGAAMVVIDDGSAQGVVEGTIGGGAIEHAIRQAALDVIATTRPRTQEFALTTQLGMCCGGSMKVFIQPIRQRPPAIILGAGHIGAALSHATFAAGFEVHVADPRAEMLTAERLGAHAALHDDYSPSDLDTLPFGPDAFVVVVTHDHATDQALVEDIVGGRAYRYLAMIGSVRKATRMRERCLNKGLDKEKVAGVFSPAGLDIGAETPHEIAVSITAQMIEVRRLGQADDCARLVADQAAR